MISSLGHHLNKTVLVSIPPIFEDQPVTCTLAGIEAAGVWLVNKDLSKKLLHGDDDRTVVPIFIPFAQIAYLLEAAEVRDRERAHDRHTQASDVPSKISSDVPPKPNNKRTKEAKENDRKKKHRL